MRSIARSTVVTVVTLLALATGAQASTVALTFDKLPSAQGWTYEAIGGNTTPNNGPFESAPSCDPKKSNFPQGTPIKWPITTPSGNNLDEQQVFWVSGGVLHQDTVNPCFPTGKQPGCPTKEGPFQWYGGTGGGGNNAYRRKGGVSKVHPFSLTVSVQILGYSTAWECAGSTARRIQGSASGFSVGASTGDEDYWLSMTDKQVIFGARGSTTLVKMDTGDRFHTYRLDVMPNVGAWLFIDESTTPQASSSGPIKNTSPKEPNGLYLGDTTGGDNAAAAVNKFVYCDCESPAGRRKVK